MKRFLLILIVLLCSDYSYSQITSTPTGGNWSDGSTWIGSILPTGTDDVIIQNGATVIVDNTTNICNNLTIDSGGTLTYIGGTTAATLTVNGNMTVNGTVNAGTGTGNGIYNLIIGGQNSDNSTGNLTVNGNFDLDTGPKVFTTFRGALDGMINGNGTICNFFLITVNKGTDKTSILEILRTIEINDDPAVTNPTATRLIITTGTFKISAPNNLKPYRGGRTICAAAGRMWLNHPLASLTSMGFGASSPVTEDGATVSGELRIDNGFFGYGTGQVTLAMGGSSSLTLNNGTVFIYGGVSISSNINAHFDMSGGEFIVDPQHTDNFTSTTFSIGANTSVNWSGGTITIVDPRVTVGGVSWNVTSINNKTVSGGKLRIGDGISGSASGILGNTAGFGITSAMPIWDLEIDNRTDLSDTRMLRVTGNTFVQNNITIKNNGYVFCGSGINSTNLFCGGNFENNGTFAGTFPTGTTFLGTLNFNGSSAQSVTGSGSWVNLESIAVNNSGMGVTFNAGNIDLFTSLNLIDGIAYTSPGNMLRLGPDVTFPTTPTDSSHIDGPVAHTINTISGTSKLFPVGKNGNYRPFTLNITQDAATSTLYKGEQIESSAPAYTLPGSLDKVSFVRYFNVTKGAGANITSGAITLDYGADDEVSDAPNLRIAKQDGTNWIDIGGTGTGSPTGSITSTVNFTSLSDFALANNTGGGNALPVELSSFTSIVERRDIHLNWMTVNEINNTGFEVERANGKGQMSNEWVRIGFVNGNGTINEAKNYSFIDRGLSTGKYKYRLKQVDYNGNFEYFNLSNEVIVGVPDKYDLSQNYPNPFNPVTKINFDLPFDSRVILKIFDMTGREVVTLVNDFQPAGYYTASFDAKNIASGMYFYRITAEGENQQYVITKKMVLVK